MIPYTYSFVKVPRPSGDTRWRGRCACGRETHMTYSQAAFALTAIRRVHNEHVPEERETHEQRSRAA